MVVIPALDTRTSVFWSTVSLNIWTIPLVRSGELFKTDCVLRLPFALRFAPLCGLWILGDVYNIECSRYIKTVICILIYSENISLPKLACDQHTLYGISNLLFSLNRDLLLVRGFLTDLPSLLPLHFSEWQVFVDAKSSSV